MRPFVLLLLLSLSFPSFAADPFVVGPEAPISSRGPERPTLENEWRMQAGAGPDGFLVVWHEPGFVSRRDFLIGRRLAPAGVPVGDRIIISSGIYSDLKVVWSGDRYVVTGTDPEGAANAWHIAADGAVEGPFPAPPIKNAAGEHIETAVQDGFFVIRFVDAEGRQQLLPTTALAHTDRVLQIVPIEDDWVLLTRSTSGEIRWARVNRSGAIAVQLVVGDKSPGRRVFSPPAIDPDGTIAMAWTEAQPQSTPRQFVRSHGFTTIDIATGTARDTVRETNLFEFPPHRSPLDHDGAPAAMFDGSEFVYAWVLWTKLEGPFADHELRVERGGTSRVVHRTRELTGWDFQPVLASGGRDLIVWQQRSTAGRDFAAHAFDDFATLTDEPEAIFVTTAPVEQRYPRAAAGKNGALVAWLEPNPGTPDKIVGRFVPESGAPGRTFVLPNSGMPIVAATGDTFLLTWRQPDGQYVLRFDSDGVALDAEPVLASSTFVASTAIGDGDSFVLGMIELSGKNAGGYALRVPRRGPVTAQPVKVIDNALAGAVREVPVLMRVEGRLLSLWATSQNRGSYVVAVPLRETLEPESYRILWFFSDWWDMRTSDLAAATNGSEVIVAWSVADGQNPRCVHTQLFSAELSPKGDAQRLRCVDDAGSTDGFDPGAVWDGQRFWASVTAEYRPGVPLQVWPIGIDGVAGEPIELAAGERDPQNATLVRAARGITAVYQRTDETSAQQRVFIRSVSARPRARAVRR